MKIFIIAICRVTVWICTEMKKNLFQGEKKTVGELALTFSRRKFSGKKRKCLWCSRLLTYFVIYYVIIYNKKLYIENITIISSSSIYFFTGETASNLREIKPSSGSYSLQFLQLRTQTSLGGGQYTCVCKPNSIYRRLGGLSSGSLFLPVLESKNFKIKMKAGRFHPEVSFLGF